MEEYKKNSKMITFEVVETMLNKVSHTGIHGPLGPNFPVQTPVFSDSEPKIITVKNSESENPISIFGKI